MGWSGGTFTRVHDWTDDESAGYDIEASRMDAEDDNFATGINSCVHKGGQNAATANLPMGGFKHTGVATATARDHYAAVSQVQDSGFHYAAGSGTNTITMTLSPAITAYAAGQKFVFKAAAANTGATTLNVNSVGAKNIFLNGAALVGGEIVADELYVVVYDGTQFQLMGVGSDFALTCFAYQTAAQSIPNSTITDLVWGEETYDVGGLHSTSSNSERFTAPVNGVYRFTVNMQIEQDATATGDRYLFLYDGVLPVAASSVAASAATMYLHCSTERYLTANDYMVAAISQNSGGALDAGTAASNAQFTLVRKMTV